VEPEWGRRPCDHSPELQAIRKSLTALERKLDTVSEQQQSIDLATAALTALTGDVAANVAQLGTDIDAIKAALAALPSSVDTSALDAAVAAAQGTAASLDSSVSSVTDLAPPAPPAAGTSN
jgi:uncharacterized protein YoxC